MPREGTNVEGVAFVNLNGTDIVEYKVVEIPVICKNRRISMTISIVFKHLCSGKSGLCEQSF